MPKHSEIAECPFCFAEIDAQARKCCHCGEWVNERSSSSRNGGSPKPAHEAITERFDEAVANESVAFAVVALICFLIWYPIGFILSLVGVFTGPRKGCFGALLAVFVLLPLLLVFAGVAVGGLMTGGVCGGGPFFWPH